MRRSLLALTATIALASGCGPGTAHQIDSIKFSDTSAFGPLLHTDTYDTRFEIGEAPHLHAHLEVKHSLATSDREVPVTCTVTGPAGVAPMTIDRKETLRKDWPLSSWLVPLKGTGETRWLEGDYTVACVTTSSRTEGKFRLVDTSPVYSKFTPGKSVLEMLNEAMTAAGKPGLSAPLAKPWGRGSPVLPQTSLKELAAEKDASPLLPLLRDYVGHEHIPAKPAEPVKSAEPTKSEPAKPVETPKPAAPPARIRPRLYALANANDEPGPLEVTGTGPHRFDAASLRYVGWQVDIPDGVALSLKGCEIARLKTGVVKTGSLAFITNSIKDPFKIRGSSGGAIATWIPGDYELRCIGDGAVLEPVAFSVTGRGHGATNFTITAKTMAIPGARPSTVNVFEFDGTTAGYANRAVFTINTGRPRYVGAEVVIDLTPSERAYSFKFTCNYFTPWNGALIGRSSGQWIVPANQSRTTHWVSWGNANGNFWIPNNYFVECDADGRFLASRFFSVERR